MGIAMAGLKPFASLAIAALVFATAVVANPCEGIDNCAYEYATAEAVVESSPCDGIDACDYATAEAVVYTGYDYATAEMVVPNPPSVGVVQPDGEVTPYLFEAPDDKWRQGRVQLKKSEGGVVSDNKQQIRKYNNKI